MGARRTEYALVGRYMDGKRVVGYHLQSADTGKNGRYTPEQFAYLVGRDQVVNCSGQIYNDTVLYRGKNGTEINSLPVQQESGEISRTDVAGHVRRGDTAVDVMNKMNIVGRIRQGNALWGYRLRNNGGQVTDVDRDTVFNMARSGMIGNARAQFYEGRQIIKGVGVDLKQLPAV